jgi:hypothetical protein
MSMIAISQLKTKLRATAGTLCSHIRRLYIGHTSGDAQYNISLVAYEKLS